jgi:tryptophan halogenase
MKIVVAGRGTAGWMSALYAKKVYPDSNVTVVYDDNIPIIGVGEGVTSIFMEFMKFLEISLEELIRMCDGTIKNGIKFTNWKGDGSHYYHGFTPIHSHIIGSGEDLCTLLSDKNKVPADFKDLAYAIHFDAKKMAHFLERVGTSRGIYTQIGKIEDATLDSNGYVSKIHLENGINIETDFIFDCTGFARFFVEKTFKSPFKSYEKSLPVKRAMPFFLKREGVTPPYTEAIAMKHGWMWKIPVGERFGCGYVFDSDYITDEEAYEEICEITGQKPDIRKKISFKAGYFTKPFNKNTVAIGLSHGFLEPLEATSLFISVIMLLNLPTLKNYSKVVDDYNHFTTSVVEECVDIIHFHYLCSRKDTKFWDEFKDKNTMPESLKEVIEYIHSPQIENKAAERSVFTVNSYFTCAYGQGYISHHTDPKFNEFIDFFKRCMDEKVEKCEFHDDFIQYCKDSSRVKTASPRV